MSSLGYFSPQSPKSSEYRPMDRSNHGTGTSWVNSQDFALNGSTSFQAINNDASTPFSFSSKPAYMDHAGPSDMATLMRIPEVKKLYDTLQSTSSMSAKMYEENQGLRLEIEGLRVEIASLKRNGDTGPYGLGRRTSLSVGPSDSISQQPSRSNTTFGFVAPPVLDAAQFRERPKEFPFEILWFKRDCQQDTNACPSDANPSRPPMKKAIRDERGDMISDEYYDSILKSATLYINELVLLVHTKAPTQAPRKTYIEKHFPSQWRSAISRFEIEHPPLALCASHWKADQLLSEMLRARKPGIVDTEGKLPTNSSSSGSKRKRVNSGAQTIANNKQKKRKPKHDEHKASSSDEDDNNGREPALDSPPLLGPNPEPSVSFEPAEPAATGASPAPNHKGKAKAKGTFSFDEIAIKALALGRGKHPQAGTATPAFLQDSGHPNKASSSVRPLPEPSVLSMINVEATYGALKEASTQEFSAIPHLPACLEQLQKASKSVAFNAQPCSSTLALLARIESADPTAPDVDEDDTNLGWGHIQFTAGGITLSTVIRSWKNIGNVETAYRLLAAAVKTCRVARHLCFTNNIVATGGFLSDSYLRNLVEIIWDILKTTVPEQANPASVATSHDATGVSSAAGPLPPAQPFEDRPPHTVAQQPTSSAATQPEISAVDDLVQDLHREELKKWIQANKIAMPSKQNKQDLIEAIRASKTLPNQEEFEHIVAQRPKKKQTSRKGKAAT